MTPADATPRRSENAEVGLVLAAGAATRFGAPKQTADFRGAPLITWPIRALVAGGLTRILVVLGAHAETVRAALEAPVVGESNARTGAAADVGILIATDWAEGLSASLRAGVRVAGERGADRVVVVLGDQPLVSGAAVARVLAASRAGAPIARGSYAQTPGHPVVLNLETFAAVGRLRGDAGARRLTGFDTVTVACDGLGAPTDVDTPENLRRIGPAGA